MRRRSTVIFPSSPKRSNSVIRGNTRTEVVLESSISPSICLFYRGSFKKRACTGVGPWLSGKLYDRDKLLTTLESFFIETSADCDTVYS